MARPTTTIRVRIETRDRLNAVASASGASAAELVDRWARQADEDLLLADAVDSWRAMSDEQLANYRAESAELDDFSADLPGY